MNNVVYVNEYDFHKIKKSVVDSNYHNVYVIINKIFDDYNIHKIINKDDFITQLNILYCNSRTTIINLENEVREFENIEDAYAYCHNINKCISEQLKQNLKLKKLTISNLFVYNDAFKNFMMYFDSKTYSEIHTLIKMEFEKSKNVVDEQLKKYNLLMIQKHELKQQINDLNVSLKNIETQIEKLNINS